MSLFSRRFFAARAARARRVPTRAELRAIDVGGFVDRLDHSLSAIASESSLASLLPEDGLSELHQDPRFAGADALFRSTLRGTLVATSFRDLPEEARMHPAVQARLWAAMDEMDTAVHGVSTALSGLTAAERAEITRALRDDPDLGARVLQTLDAEAEKAGVSGARRDHLQKLGKQACFRLRQSTSGFIDEYSDKVQKSRALTLVEAEKRLSAQWGEAALQEERTWQFAVLEEWQKVLAAGDTRLAGAEDPSGVPSDNAYAPPAGHMIPPSPPAGGGDANAGRTVIKVGAYLFGFGVLVGATSALLMSTGNDNAQITGLFGFTAAALLSLGGMVCLLVGAILRVSARSRQLQ